MKDYNEIAENALRRGKEIRKHNIEVRNKVLRAGSAVAACAVIGIFAYSFWPYAGAGSGMTGGQKAAGADDGSTFFGGSTVEQQAATVENKEEYAVSTAEEQPSAESHTAIESDSTYIDPSESDREVVAHNAVNSTATDKKDTDENGSAFAADHSKEPETNTSQIHLPNQEVSAAEAPTTAPAVILPGDPSYEGAQGSRVKPQAGEVFQSKQLTDLLANDNGEQYEIKIYLYKDGETGTAGYDVYQQELTRIEGGSYRVFIDGSSEEYYLHAYMTKDSINGYSFDQNLGYWMILKNEYI